MPVVKRKGPKALDGGKLVFWEGHRVASFGRVQPRAGRVQILIEMLRLVRLVYENVGSGNGCARKIIGSESRAVVVRGPIVRKRDAEVAIS